MKKFFLSIILYLFLSGCILNNAFLPQTYTGILTQLWTITITDDGYYLIKNNNSGMVLTTFNDGQTDGTLIVQTYYIGLNNQKWIIF